MFDLIPDTVRVFSALADVPRLGGNCLRSWMLARSADTDGNGIVTLRITEMAQACGVSRSTMRRYLWQGLKLGVFRAIDYFHVDGDRRRDGVTIYYTSLINTCATLGLEDFGAVADVGMNEFHHTKHLATELIAQQLQNSAMFLEQKRNKRKPISPDALIPSAISGGGPVRQKGRLVFVSLDQAPAGVSQRKIAYESMRSQRTTQRRLSNLERIKRDINPIIKKQMVQELPDTIKALYLSGFVLPTWFVLNHTLYKYWTNLYYFGRQLLPQRYQRRQLKRLLKKSLCPMINSEKTKNRAIDNLNISEDHLSLLPQAT